MAYSWRFPKFKADPNKVAAELNSLGDGYKPEQVLEYARNNPDSELHKCFEWNDSVAAEKYRMSQARMIVCELVYEKPKNAPNDYVPIRVFHQLDGKYEYKKTAVVVRHPDQYQLMLKRAMEELAAFKRKYKNLTELDEILALIP